MDTIRHAVCRRLQGRKKLPGLCHTTFTQGSQSYDCSNNVTVHSRMMMQCHICGNNVAGQRRMMMQCHNHGDNVTIHSRTMMQCHICGNNVTVHSRMMMQCHICGNNVAVHSETMTQCLPGWSHGFQTRLARTQLKKGVNNLVMQMTF